MSKIWFILPIYNEEKNINILYEHLIKIVKKINCEYEFLFIDDKWKDNSLKLLLELQEKDKNIKIIEFSRNFWHEIAVKAGLDIVDWDYIIMMDTDLQDPPEIIHDMYNKIIEWYDVVYATRKKRSDWFFKDTTAHFFYRFINKLSDVDIPKDTWNFRMFTKQVLQEIIKLNEQSRFIRWLFAWIWFKQTFVEFERKERLYWETGYSWNRMINLSLDAIFSFSNLPLRLATLVWFIFSWLWFLIALIFIIVKLVNPSIFVSWVTTLIILVFLIGGIQLIILWIIWEYIGRIYKEDKSRPLYIIKKVYG